MLLKLKRTPFLLSVLAVLLAFGYVGQVAADTTAVTAACADNSTALTISAPNKGKVTVTCKSKAKFVIGEMKGKKTVTIQSVCPSTQDSMYDGPTTSRSSYIFSCQRPDGKIGANPAVTIKAATSTSKTNTPSTTNSGTGAVEPAVDEAAKGGNCSKVENCDIIQKYINPAVNFLAAFVGIAVVISIVIGGIQYGSSAGDSQKVTAAKNRIRNSIIALIAFVFLYTVLNFLVPGGLR